MSINSSAVRKAGPFVGNGVQTSFPFTYKVFQASDLYVVLTDLSGAEVVQTLTSQYTVALNADQNANPGGSVLMVAAPAVGFLLTLGSQVPQTQPLQLANLGGFSPNALNDAYDRLTILVQQLAEQLLRAVKVNFSSSTSPDQLVAAINTAASNSAASASAASASATAAGGSQTAAAASAAQAAASSAASGVRVLSAVAGTNTITGTAASLSAYGVGLFAFVPANTNTGAVTLNLNGLGAVAVVKQGATALAAGDLIAGDGALVEYDGTQFQLVNPVTAASQAQVQTGSTVTSAAGGTADALTGAFTPAVTALTNGTTLLVRAANANATTTPTFTPNNGTIAAKTIVKGNNLALVAGDIAGAGHWLELQYDSTLDKWELLNPATGVATITSGNDGTFADNSVKPASTNWVRGAMSAIATAAGFAASLNASGYVKLPSYLGGWVIQWVQAVSGAGGHATGSWPLTFPNSLLIAVGTQAAWAAAPTAYAGVGTPTTSSYDMWTSTGGSGQSLYGIAIGK